MRLIVTGGGTAGHVYPALTILGYIRKAIDSNVEALYVGSSNGMEREIVERSGFPFAGVPAAPIRGQGLLGTLRGFGVTTIGLLVAVRIVVRFRPDAILATGGYVSAPAVLAGWLRRVGTVVFLPDVIPGWAVRGLSRLCYAVACTTSSSRPFLPKARLVETGYPVRPGFERIDAETARKRLGLTTGLFTVVVVGGSRGARTINNAILDGLPHLLKAGQVLHIAGHADFDRLNSARSLLPEHQRQRYHLEAYLDDTMPIALSAADIIVSRAGASTLGEYPAVGRPSLLVPGPFSGQSANAAFLVSAGASESLANDEANLLVDRILGLACRPGRLRAMAEAAGRLAKPDAAADIGRLVIEAAGGRC